MVKGEKKRNKKDKGWKNCEREEKRNKKDKGWKNCEREGKEVKEEPRRINDGKIVKGKKKRQMGSKIEI